MTWVAPGNHDYFFDGTINQGHYDEYKKKFDALVGYSDYPHVTPIGDAILIVLDSMEGQVKGLTANPTDDHWAQGRLGADQLSKLKQLLAGYRKDREGGKKIVVCLHHSPFHNTHDDTTGGLDDCEDFLGIVANKIDCLLFGHTGDAEQYFQEQEKMYGIPLINSENVENCGSAIPITVVDLAKNQVEVLLTDLSDSRRFTKSVTTKDGLQPSSGAIHITPWVTRSDAVTYNYSDAAPAVLFCSWDTISMTIGGGVQTGGSGPTWKRYVNPSGDKSDHLYFGEIYIPGITSGLTPIRDLVGTHGSYDSKSPDVCNLKFAIGNIDNLPESSRYLALGYKDDGYSDNGYWGHDDGTENQCKNVGDAYVDISIQRHIHALIQGTVTDAASGRPVVEGYVEIIAGTQSLQPRLDSTGKYSVQVQDISAGVYTVFVIVAPHYTNLTATITIPPEGGTITQTSPSRRTAGS